MCSSMAKLQSAQKITGGEVKYLSCPMGEVLLRLSQKKIPGCPIVEIGEMTENSSRKPMYRWSVSIGEERPDPRGECHNVKIVSGPRKTSAVGEIAGHFEKSAKRSKNEQNEPKLEKVNNSQLSGNEKVNKSQLPRKYSKY